MSERKLKGFAAMSPELRREIASSGGRAAHAKGTAHRYTSEEARAAARKSHAPGNSRKAASCPASSLTA